MFQKKLTIFATLKITNKKIVIKALSDKEKRIVKEFINKYHKNIISKWVKFFILKQSVRSTNIKKRL